MVRLAGYQPVLFLEASDPFIVGCDRVATVHLFTLVYSHKRTKVVNHDEYVL